MIRVVFYNNSDKNICGFSVEGHAGYAKYGKDIVCAGVSALTINTINSIEALTDNSVEYIMEDSGLIKFKFKTQPDEMGLLLINSYMLGIKNLNEEYGNMYLQLYFKEV